MRTVPELEAAAIRSAWQRMPPVFRDSPQYVHDDLSARLGVPVIVKVETVNPIRSFKGRGTWIAIHALAEEGRIGPDRPVVCAWAGNFGQGVMGSISGVPVIMSAGLDNDDAFLFSSAAIEVFEQRVGTLQATEPSVLGVQVAYAGYFTPLTIEEDAIVPIELAGS